MNWPGKATGPHGSHPTEGLAEAQVQGARGLCRGWGWRLLHSTPYLKALPEKASQLGFDFDFIFVFQAGSGSGNNGINVCKGFGGFFFSFSFFFLWSSFSSSAGLDSHLNFRSLEEPLAGEDGRGRGVGGGQEGESWVGGRGGRQGSFSPLGLCIGCAPSPQPLPLLVAWCLLLC